MTPSIEQNDAICPVVSISTNDNLGSNTENISHSTSPPHLHPMLTRSQHHIRKPKLLQYENPKYPLPYALTASRGCSDT